MSTNSFDARAELKVGDRTVDIFRLDALQSKFDVARLPFSLKVLLENLLRTEGNGSVDGRGHRGAGHVGRQGRAEQGDRLHARARGHAGLHRRARRRRPRRDARRDGRPRRRPGADQPARPRRAGHRPLRAGRRLRHARRLHARTPSASSSATRSATRSCAGARRRSTTSPSSRPTPGSSTRSTSSTSRAWCSSTTSAGIAYPDTLVGTDSHTTMINGLGVLGWGVGGIEAEAAMLGQPMSMLIPQVLGFKLSGELPEGATATDLVLTVTEILRQKGVVGKFVEFYGPGVSRAAAGRPRDDRQHEPGVRLDVRDLPDRRRDAALPGVLGPPEGAHRPRRGLRQGAGPLARREHRGADVLGHRRARPRRGRAVARRAQAPAGPRPAGRAPRTASAPRWPSSSARTPGRRSPTATTRRWPRASRPPTRRPTARPGHEADPNEPSPGPRGRGRRDGRRALGDGGRGDDGRRDVQARPRPRRHRGDHDRARTPRTRRSCSAPACWRATRSRAGCSASRG